MRQQVFLHLHNICFSPIDVASKEITTVYALEFLDILPDNPFSVKKLLMQ
jgi:hypothetical protein